VPVIWEYLSHPERQVLWMADSANATVPGGARGPGMTNHCVHGASAFDLDVLDWIPFEYQSWRCRAQGLTTLYTLTFEAMPDGGTHLVARLASAGGRVGRLVFPIAGRRWLRQYRQWMTRLEAQVTG